MRGTARSRTPAVEHPIVRRSIKHLCLLPALVFSVLLAACEQTSPPAKALHYTHAPDERGISTYRFAIHPLHNPQKLSAAYQPLVSHLNRQLRGAHIELEASRDYISRFEREVRPVRQQ